MTTPLDTLVVEVTADDVSFRKALAGASAQARAWASSLKPTLGGVAAAFSDVTKRTLQFGTAAAATAVGGISLLVKNSLEATDAIAKMSDKTGVQIETLYGWQVAADDVGVELASVTRMSQILQRHISEAAAGNKEAADTFNRLGLTMAQLRGMSPEQAFGAVADKLNLITNQADKTALGMQTLGRGFMENSNFIRLGSEGLEKATNRAKELGLTLSRVDAAKLEAVNDSFDELKSVVAGVGNTFAVALSPYIKAFTDDIVRAATESGGFKREINELVEGLAGRLGGILDMWHGLAIQIAAVKTVFYGFAVGVNYVVNLVIGLGKSLWETAKTGEAGFMVMQAAIGYAFTKMVSTVGLAMSEMLHTLASGMIAAGVKGSASVITAANKISVAVGGATASSKIAFDELSKAAGTQAEKMRASWGEALNATAGESVNLLAEARAELTKLGNAPLPSEQFDAWAAKAKATIDEVARAVASATQPTAQGSGESPTGQEGGTTEAISSIFAIGKLESDHKAYSEVLAEKLVETQEQRREFQANADLEMEAMKEQHLLNMEQSEMQSQARTVALWQSGWQGKAQIVGSILGQLSALQNTHSRKQFEVWKAAAIGETIVNTYSAAMGAFNSLAAIPYVGYALGVAAAAATMAAGMANVSKISSTQFGGGGGGSAPTAPQLGAGSGANAATGGDAGGVYGNGQGNMSKQVIIQLQGDSMYSTQQVRGLMDAINQQIGDGGNIGSLRTT